MIIAIAQLCVSVALAVLAYVLRAQSQALREECQLMRTARSASSQCPLVGHVRINPTNVI